MSDSPKAAANRSGEKAFQGSMVTMRQLTENWEIRDICPFHLKESS
jgi:hypothetical protein